MRKISRSTPFDDLLFDSPKAVIDEIMHMNRTSTTCVMKSITGMMGKEARPARVVEALQEGVSRKEQNSALCFID